MSVSISQEKLERRRMELRRRKHSFVELIMQTRKSIYREQMRRRSRARDDLNGVKKEAASSCDS